MREWGFDSGALGFKAGESGAGQVGKKVAVLDQTVPHKPVLLDKLKKLLHNLVSLQ